MAVRRQKSKQMEAAAGTVVEAPALAVNMRPPAGRARMMRQYDLVDRVRAYNPDTDEDLLNRAYVYTMRVHGSQTRASGDPYFAHPIEVAVVSCPASRIVISSSRSS